MIHKRQIKFVAAVVFLITSSSFLTAAPPEGLPNVSPNGNQTPSYRPDSLLVRFKPGASSENVSAAHGKVSPKSVKSFDVISGLKHVILPPGRSLEDALAQYRKNPNVLYAEPDYQYQLSAVPNDTFLNNLWAINNFSQAIPQLPDPSGISGTLDADINAQEAWDNVVIPPASGVWNSTTGGYAEVVVGVIDTGVDYHHPDLAANMWINPGETAANGTDDDNNGYVDDVYGINPFGGNTNPDDTSGHGTHVAGTIAAEGNNAIGVIGAAWNAKILPCTAGNSSTIDSSAAIVCMEYFYELKTRATNPVNIVVSNNSWGGTGYSQAVYDAIDMQRQAGILFVAAAGNSNLNNDTTPHYPVGYHLPNIIGVANTTNTDAKSSSSNYGRRSVTVGAPGDKIVSTYPIGTGGIQTPDYAVHYDYASASGTSMAAPQVSGLIALASTQDNNRDWKALKNLIISSGTPISALTNTTVSGRRISAWDTDGTGALSCVNQIVNSTLQPQASSTLAQAGQLGLAVLNINCDVGAGNVIVSTTGASAVNDIVLLDDGLGYDKEAGDGVYSAYWSAPSTAGAYTLTFPDGQTTSVTVDATMNPYRQAQSVTPVYETFTDWYTPFTLPNGSYSILSSNFPIKFGDHSTGFSALYLSNGWISFHTPGTVDALNAGLPSSMQNTFIVPFWDDLNLNSSGTMHLGYTGTSPNKMVVEWRDLPHASTAGTVKFQVVFTENSSDVQVNYFDATFGDVAYNQAASATIGMQIHNSSATEFSYNSASITDNSSYLWQTNSGAPTSVNAGIDQNVTGNTQVNLSGSATDPDGGVITYSWVQLSGTTVTMSNANTATPSFTAPDVTETLTFIMTVQDDAGFTGSDAVNINVTAAPSGGVLQFTASAFTVAENGATVTITASRTNGSTGAVYVDYASANVSATAGSDYTAATGTLNWIDGDIADKSFNVSITDDVIYESDETVALSLSNVTGGASLGISSATLTITENDVPGTLSFSAPTYTVSENGTTATITVSRTLGSDGAISVNYASANGNAIAGSDYTAATGTLSWGNADTADKTFSVFITDDTSYELDETIALSLSNVIGGASLGTYDTATLTITTNDAVPGTLALSSPTYSVNENGTTATITATRSGGSDAAVSIDYASANGSATAGSDYTATSGTLNWTDGDSTNKTFTVSITDDGTYEADETISLNLSGVTGGASVGTSSATLTIIDNDAVPGTLALSNTNYSIIESGTTATITISRTGGSDGAVSVNFTSTNGTATAGSDYAAATGTLNWADGDIADKTFNVSVTDDANYESDETVTLTLSGMTGGATLGTNNATLTITDNDAAPGTLALSATSYSVNENGATATIAVTRTGGSDTAVSINYASTNGSATAGSDYTVASGTLSWANGDTTAKTFDVTITDDAVYEGDETVNLSLSIVTGGATIGTSTAVLTIIEDDVAPSQGTLTLTSSGSIAENAGSISITVSRLGGSSGAVSVDYASANGSATAGSDYTAATGTLNWADGDTTVKTFNVTIIDDVIYENDETVALSLSNVTGGASLGTSSATLTITENDVPGTLAFTAPSYSVTENGATATITVSRTLGNDGAVSVNYASTDSTATAGTDYSSVAGTLSWATGDISNKSFSVNITDDSVFEGNETLTLSLTNASGGVALGTSIATLTITENDVMPVAGTLALSSTTYSVNENGATATITVSRIAGSDGAVSVNYASANGTATAGNDYNAATGTLNWVNGDISNKSFSVNITDDTVFEGDETLTLSLTNVSGGATMGTSSATLTINDDETASSNQIPSAPTLVSPGDGATSVNSNNMSFTWDTSTDPDGDTVSYQLFYCENADFIGCTATNVDTNINSASMMFGVGGGMGLAMLGMVSTGTRRQKLKSMLAVAFITLLFSGCGAPSTPPGINSLFSQITAYVSDVQPGTTYHWKVIADDGNGGLTSSPVWTLTTN